jgi:ATP-dependent Clp protease ATP-binding subunit ClpA
VQSSGGDRTVEGADVLVAMYSERDSFAVYF